MNAFIRCHDVLADFSCLYWRIDLLTLSGTYVGFLERVKICESDCYNR